MVAVPCAYGLSRLGRKTARSVNVLVAVAAAFPYVLLFLALLQVARDLHLGNNLLALSLPYTGLSLPLAILLLQASFRDIPPELEEAARLEGLGLWQRLRWVLLPLMAPAIASASLLIFLFCWNEYPIALTWLTALICSPWPRRWRGLLVRRCSPFPMEDLRRPPFLAAFPDPVGAALSTADRQRPHPRSHQGMTAASNPNGAHGALKLHQLGRRVGANSCSIRSA